MTARERDLEIQRLERMAAHREGRTAPSDEEWGEGAKNRRDREGSYVELEKILSEMDWEDVYFLDYIETGFVRDNKASRAREERLIAEIANKMPRIIELPHGLHAQDMARVEPLARHLSSKGNKVTEVAHMLGVSRRKVRSMLRKR